MKKLVSNIINKLESQADDLTELDRKIGDADHGNNMKHGFEIVQSKLDKTNDDGNSIFKMIGETLLGTVGGASGPLYGMSFINASKKLEESSELSLEGLKSIASEFTNTIKTLGQASIGDKTMLDVWAPFDEYLKGVDNSTFDKQKASELVQKLCEGTKDIVAKRGRASYLGDRSKGTIDPGAYSSMIIIKELIEATNV